MFWVEVKRKFIDNFENGKKPEGRTLSLFIKEKVQDG